jgi:hypothetical protein
MVFPFLARGLGVVDTAQGVQVLNPGVEDRPHGTVTQRAATGRVENLNFNATESDAANRPHDGAVFTEVPHRKIGRTP